MKYVTIARKSYNSYQTNNNTIRRGAYATHEGQLYPCYEDLHGKHYIVVPFKKFQDRRIDLEPQQVEWLMTNEAVILRRREIELS